jgi:hypothetical protein
MACDSPCCCSRRCRRARASLVAHLGSSIDLTERPTSALVSHRKYDRNQTRGGDGEKAASAREGEGPSPLRGRPRPRSFGAESDSLRGKLIGLRKRRHAASLAPFEDLSFLWTSPHPFQRASPAAGPVAHPMSNPEHESLRASCGAERAVPRLFAVTDALAACGWPIAPRLCHGPSG